MTLNTPHRTMIAAWLWSRQDLAECMTTCVAYSVDKDHAARWAHGAMQAAGVTHTDTGERISRIAIRFAMTMTR